MFFREARVSSTPSVWLFQCSMEKNTIFFHHLGSFFSVTNFPSIEPQANPRKRHGWIWNYLNDHSYAKFNDLGLSYYKFTSRWENHNSTRFLSLVCFFGNVKKSSSCWGLSSCWGTVVFVWCELLGSTTTSLSCSKAWKAPLCSLGLERDQSGSFFSTHSEH